MLSTKLQAIRGDITQLKVDVIVNAANTQLAAGAGVCGAIHNAAGPELLSECLTLQGCPTGDAKITKGYRLPAQFVIHAVGPVWRGGKEHEARLLASCYRKSLEIAVTHHLKTIAFPAISCGIYGYPIKEAATIAVDECLTFLELHDEIDKIYFVCFDQTLFEIYEALLK